MKDVNEAIEHINFYGSGHTDCIVTEDEKAKEVFLRKVDSSSVMHKSSKPVLQMVLNMALGAEGEYRPISLC